MRSMALAAGASALAAGLLAAERPFEVAAWVDHYDFAAVQEGGGYRFDTETPQGIAAILDHVQETGATTILWRNCAGSTMRYQSGEESHHNDSQLDKRRVLEGIPVYGWVRYGEAEPDIIRTMVSLCRDRGLRPGIHWPFEENHWAIFTIGRWNLEHPQYWGRTADGQPWWGRTSLAFEPVVQHKLRLVDELLERGVECLFLDFFRTGGWGPHAEYVEPLVRSFRRQYGEAPPADSSDPRWVRHASAPVTAFIRRLHERLRQRRPAAELMVGLPNIAPIGDRTMVEALADWRTWVDEGLVDTVVINNVCWDTKDPMGTTRELYREVLRFVDGRCRVLLPVCAYNYHQHGMPRYEEVTGRSQAETARELATMAWEEGAAGISLECVDYGNYNQATRQLLRKLREGPCRLVSERVAAVPGDQGPASPTAAAPPPDPATDLGEPPVPTPPAAPPVALTTGPGNDTEAAWSPDGRRIVFQSDRGGSLGLYILDLDAGQTTPLAVEPGNACFPAWSPDGTWIAYAYGSPAGTAVQGGGAAYNLFVVPSTGGPARQLTSGHCRDYTPSFAHDGTRVLFASSRGSGREQTAVSLYAVPLAGGEPTPVLPLAGNDVAAVQPTASGDGRLLAYGFVSGFRSNWALRLARTEDPTDAFPLTDGDAPFYGPRWSPGHRLLACTGYLLGDPGWGVYLVDATTGNRVRVNTGPGNSRSPAWSPDGTELVFESNRSGAYKLYRVPVPSLPPAGASDVTPQAAEATPPQGDEPVLAFSFAEGTRAIVRDLSGRGNDGTIEGDAQWQDGTLRFAGKGFVTVPSPKGFDFGEGAFSIRVTLQVAEHTSSLRLIAVGDYPGNRLGWQLYLADSNQVWFNSRTPQLVFAGAVSDTVLPVGRKVTLVGIRHATGAVRLFVDGVRQASAATGAAYRYPAPNQFRLGAQFNGQHGFTGQVHEVSVYPRALTPAEIGRRSLQEFLARP